MVPDTILAELARLPATALLRLRLPALDDAAYGEAASGIVPVAQAHGLRVLLDRSPAMAVALGADGWHASVAQLQAPRVRPSLLIGRATGRGRGGQDGALSEGRG